MSKEQAIRKVEEFRSASGAGRWSGIQRAALADGLIARINNPNLIAQSANPLCGPAATVRAIARDDPLAYATAAIDLFNRGEATIGRLRIQPGSELLGDSPQGNANPADWILLASIRDSDNWFLSPSGILGSSLAGITRPGSIEQWLRDAGYTMVVNKTYLAFKPLNAVLAVELGEANKHFRKGWWVLILLDADVLSSGTQDDAVSMYPDHWVVLDSEIRDGGIVNYNSPIQFTAWSWGRTIAIPERASKPLTKRDFLHKYYGYIAARR